MAHYETTMVHGREMRVYLALPQGEGPFPAVVEMCHGPGVDGFTTAVCDRLAANGYAGVAPDLFHRQPGVTDPAKKREKMDDAEIIADIEATLALLRQEKAIDPSRLAIMGHCMGGRMAFLGACEVREFKGAVIYYGGNMFTAWGGSGPAPFERLNKLKCPVQGFFGMDDDNPSPADVNRIEARLEALGVRRDFHRYVGAGHAFQNFLREASYREGAAEDAWNRTFMFLKDRLG